MCPKPLLFFELFANLTRNWWRKFFLGLLNYLFYLRQNANFQKTRILCVRGILCKYFLPWHIFSKNEKLGFHQRFPRFRVRFDFCLMHPFFVLFHDCFLLLFCQVKIVLIMISFSCWSQKTLLLWGLIDLMIGQLV